MGQEGLRNLVLLYAHFTSSLPWIYLYSGLGITCNNWNIPQVQNQNLGLIHYSSTILFRNNSETLPRKFSSIWDNNSLLDVLTNPQVTFVCFLYFDLLYRCPKSFITCWDQGFILEKFVWVLSQFSYFKAFEVEKLVFDFYFL